jgi:hypothetical protein
MQEATSLRANSPVVIHSSDICVIITFIFCNYRVEKVFVFVCYVVYYLSTVYHVENHKVTSLMMS